MSEGLETDPFAQREAARQMTRVAMRTGLPAHGELATPAPESVSHIATATPISHRNITPLWIAAAGVTLLAAMSIAGLVLFQAPAQHGAVAAVTVPAVQVASTDEAGVLAAPQDRLGIFRLTADPAVLVLAFPSLHEQALALDRIGAFVEKAGMPHDHVLTEDELAARIAAAGEDFDTFYYGHDYRAADLARFFASASLQKLALNSEETSLHVLLSSEGMLKSGAVGAVISVPPQSGHPPVDSASRETILRHEASHGAYFTDPVYADYTKQFWSDVMTDPERAAFRKMLGGEGYDTSNEDLMRNEMQAYLVHTPDRRFFDPTRLGIDAVSLRSKFVKDMPAGWLRDETP